MTNLLGEEIDEKPKTFDWQIFMDTWNQNRNLPRIITMTKERRDKFRLRCKNELFVKHWRHMVAAMNLDTSYHGNKGWQKCLVDYFLRNDTNWVRVLETHPIGKQVVVDNRNKWDIAAEKQ